VKRSCAREGRGARMASAVREPGVEFNGSGCWTVGGKGSGALLAGGGELGVGGVSVAASGPLSCCGVTGVSAAGATHRRGGIGRVRWRRPGGEWADQWQAVEEVLVRGTDAPKHPAFSMLFPSQMSFSTAC